MNNYKKMFDEINISDDCMRKVRNMETKNKKIRKFKIRYAAVVLVALALFATSDVVSYAATGSGIAKHIQVFITDNGDKTKLKETEDGSYIYKDKDKKVKVQINKDTLEKESLNINADVNNDKDEVNLQIGNSDK